jgi:hypothetical protein
LEETYRKHFVKNHITIFFCKALSKKSSGFDTWVVGGWMDGWVGSYEREKLTYNIEIMCSNFMQVEQEQS